MSPLILAIFSLAVIATNSETIPEPKTNAACSAGSSCVKIFDCDKLYQLYKYKQPEWREQESLRSANCGWENGAPKVCCVNGGSNRRRKRASTCGISTSNTSPNSNQRIKRLTGKTRKALLGSWPWMAALYYQNPSAPNKPKFQCGATLISSEWILTAAHCVANAKLAYVRLGDLDLDKNVEDGATPIEVNVTQIIKHPQFSAKSKANNIALVRLSKPVEYTQHIRPICVRGGDAKYLNESYYGQKKAVMIGWGTTTKGKELSTHLLEVDLDVVPSAKCAENYAKVVTTDQIRANGTMICANTNDGNDSCQGDSGGPLMFRDNDVWWIGGLSSHGFDCGRPEYPGIYTKVPAYVDWINTSTGLKF